MTALPEQTASTIKPQYILKFLYKGLAIYKPIDGRIPGAGEL
jgi:hypothetical protein